MTSTILDMPSYTYALKAQRLLRSRGYPCRIKRREKNAERGCGYSVHIMGISDSPLKLLDRYAVPYTLINGGGEVNDKL